MSTAGRDYPGSYAEFLAWFRDEEACWDYLEWLRWPQPGIPLSALSEPAWLATRQRAL